MSRYLFACTPAQGHLSPLLSVASHMVGAGHEVVFFTSRHLGDKVEKSGARFIPFGDGYDAYELFLPNPDHDTGKRPSLRSLKNDIKHAFLDPGPGQSEGIRRILADFPAHVVICDTTFTGTVPLALGPRADRPALAYLGIFPVTLTSRDTAPFGLALQPRPGLLGALRNTALNWLIPNVVMADVQRYGQDIMKRVGAPPIDRFIMDAPFSLVEAYLQATVPGFEYPRRDLPESFEFVGAILSPPTTEDDLPRWWDEMKAAPRRVHVTQGTLANFDLGHLVAPTLAGLAADDVIVIATTGGPDPSALPVSVPVNARVERFVPHAQLLPHMDVMVTNGGYGGVHQALSCGVPLVAAGVSEDKPEVAARVKWSGAGIDLRTARPSADQVGNAVRTVLGDPNYKESARRLQAEIATYDTLQIIHDRLEALAAQA